MQPVLAHGEPCVLSDGEALVVRLLLCGYRVPLIARQLHLSPSTVRNQLHRVPQARGELAARVDPAVLRGVLAGGRNPARPARWRGTAPSAAALRGLPLALVAVTPPLG